MNTFFKYSTILILTSFLMISCSEKNIQDVSKDTKVKITSNSYDINTLPSNLFVFGKIENDTLLCTDNNKTTIFSYNLKNNLKSDIVKTSNGKFIKKSVYNSDWIIWIENESLKTDLSNKPYNWEIKAKNIKTNQEISIDKSNFNNNSYNIPTYTGYTPEYIDISTDNNVVYGKVFLQPSGDIVNKVMSFNINDLSLIEITTPKNINENYLSGLSIDGNKIVWSECSEYDTSGTWSTHFKNSNIYYYSIDTKETSTLTNDGYYSNPIINKNIIIAEKFINDQDVATSDIVQIDIEKKAITKIVDQSSIFYSNNKGYSKSLNCLININDKYVSWNNLIYNRAIYDRENNIFIDLLDNNQYKNIISVNGMFDNYVFLTVESANNTIESLYLVLK